MSACWCVLPLADVAFADVALAVLPVCGVLPVAPFRPVAPLVDTPGAVGAWIVLLGTSGTFTPVVDPAIDPAVSGMPGSPFVTPGLPGALVQPAFTESTGWALSAAPRIALTHAPVGGAPPADVPGCRVPPLVSVAVGTPAAPGVVAEPALEACVGECWSTGGRVPCGMKLLLALGSAALPLVGMPE